MHQQAPANFTARPCHTVHRAVRSLLERLESHLSAIELRLEHPHPSRLSTRAQPRQPKCAYVTLVMRGDLYVPGAIVVAQSLRRTATPHTLVCMVTHDVSQRARAALALLYDEVVPVDYIKYPAVRLHTQKEREKYQKWMDVCMTLYRCLWLTAYDKILLLDGDVCILQSMDGLFDLQPPAACFDNPWLSGTPLDPYPRTLGHGDPIPHKSIERAFATRGSFVCLGGCILLAPGKDVARAFQLHLDRFTAAHGALGYSSMNSGVDVQMITHFYAFPVPDARQESQLEPQLEQESQWTHISPDYQCIPWKRRASDSNKHLFHYFNIKPWDMGVDEFPDLAPWWASATQACSRFPALAEWFPRNPVTLKQRNRNKTPQAGPSPTCFWCCGRHPFMDFNTNTILCPTILANPTQEAASMAPHLHHI